MIDLFGEPFKFYVSYKNAERKTHLGQCLSAVIIGLSISYLVYLLYEFFSKKIPPKIVNYNFLNDGEDTEYLMNYSPIAF